MKIRLREFNVQIRIRFWNFDIPLEKLLPSLPPKPHTAFNKGARDAKKIIPRANLLVYLSQATKWEDGFDVHWSNLKKVFCGYDEVLRNLAMVSERVLCTVVVDHAEQFPSLILSNDFLEFVAGLNAEVEIDVVQGEDCAPISKG